MPRHRRKQRQQDNALLAIAAAAERQRLHHGAASYQMAWDRKRCLARDCIMQKPTAQPAVTYTDTYTRCFRKCRDNPDAMTEQEYQELADNGGLPPHCKDNGKGSGYGKGGNKGNGKGAGKKWDAKGASKGTKGKGKNGKGKGKNKGPSYSVTAWNRDLEKDQEIQRLKSELEKKQSKNKSQKSPTTKARRKNPKH